MRTSDFNYYLPEELIAQTPIEPRDHSKLMLVERDQSAISHDRFFNLPKYLRQGDVLVFNDSRVISARLYGSRDDTGNKIELLLLSRLREGVWRALVRPGRRMRENDYFIIHDRDGNKSEMTGQVLEVEESGSRIIKITNEFLIEDIGNVPLPPYIHEKVSDPERYQTIYAKSEGSVAAPTAGLHFTEELMSNIRDKGVLTEFVTLHVGWDSFRPLKSENIFDHKMHSEYWHLSNQTALNINEAKQEGRRIISVGTTAARLLENVFEKQNGYPIREGSGWADIFITPGYEFRVLDGLITNFHLPKSTLLMLTSALSGRDLMLKAYREAVDSEYRFYSFGDAMLIF
ncbi:MAG: tRNA preQ1(34) S-adenosylmethionine ribosyltransferase-isomerase QueA [Chloroflexi bacterium]|nr:tRNA preQ1(34) S-adenosylmethionine ribosyltransferase-isomerase QueA [Chloroflexota bacterium]MQG01043.1 tRNA preQ1(34) S-adenosylmethionine ribosyltransferase-isomerase QueA [SAR202 cluster bacterium]